MTKRIDSIDILRGMSIIGILFMNIVGFHMNEVYTNPLAYFPSSIDQSLYKFNVLFIHNSFYPIFAFLFGFGLAIMANNITNKGANFLPILYRRTFTLLIFGLLHGVFIFYGDILNVYAVLGMIGIIFLMLPNAVTFVVALLLMMIELIRNVPVMLSVMMQPGLFHQSRFNFEVSQNDWLQVMSHGDFSKIISYNAAFFYEGFSAINPDNTVSYCLSVLPFILLGMFVFRANLLRFITLHKFTMLTISFVSACIGLLLKQLMITYEISPLASSGYIYYGGVLLSISYMIWVLLLSENGQIKRCFKPFQLMGKMSFTLYIMQSLIMFIVFYGFKLYGKLNLVEVNLIALSIVIFQMAFTYIYFKQFKQGPLEWLWRKITYMK
ncbi:DUF418 domain-containing protein [Macrococcoides caseolyticum]|uniref:DUF418 domain-containing protein n=1 Tax=Macrococcoides caseolyticum TaxID=69966 RepID=UPI001F3B820F|nr:DUF418 domain-containing protein [Macrococcus caseolyticus]MCE4955969.1 DUF418 domain-containing protein [Macrococcus caseolyticus]